MSADDETVWALEADTYRAEQRWAAEPDWAAGRARGDRLTEWDTVPIPGLDLGPDALHFGPS